jgi:hypothetical protein
VGRSEEIWIFPVTAEMAIAVCVFDLIILLMVAKWFWSSLPYERELSLVIQAS